MGAAVLPFPLIRRRDFVARHVARTALAQPKTAEKLLPHVIEVQVHTMHRRIAAAVVKREAKALESAIRSEFCRPVILEGSAA